MHVRKTQKTIKNVKRRDRDRQIPLTNKNVARQGFEKEEENANISTEKAGILKESCQV